MTAQWDSCNKWLYLGGKQQWVILLDDWMNWFPLDKLAPRSWTLFRITWDNGAWWAFDMDNALILDEKKHGHLRCYAELMIFGVGIRRYYDQKVVFDEEGFKKYLRDLGKELGVHKT